MVIAAGSLRLSIKGWTPFISVPVCGGFLPLPHFFLPPLPPYLHVLTSGNPRCPRPLLPFVTHGGKHTLACRDPSKSSRSKHSQSWVPVAIVGRPKPLLPPNAPPGFFFSHVFLCPPFSFHITPCSVFPQFSHRSPATPSGSSSPPFGCFSICILMSFPCFGAFFCPLSSCVELPVCVLSNLYLPMCLRVSPHISTLLLSYWHGKGDVSIPTQRIMECPPSVGFCPLGP